VDNWLLYTNLITNSPAEYKPVTARQQITQPAWHNKYQSNMVKSKCEINQNRC